MRAKIVLAYKSKKVLVKLYQMEQRNKKAIHDALFEIGKENVKYCQDLMLEKKTGRIYNIKGIEHQASAPGEAPALRSGNLFRSIDYEVRGSSEMEFGDKSQSDKAPYGLFLEEGVPQNNLDPRPHIGRTVEDRQKEALNSFNSHIKKNSE